MATDRTEPHAGAGHLPTRGAGTWMLCLLPLLAAGGLAMASLRHSGSVAFPIDDAYIYSNYVTQAAQGHLFTYNSGQSSGGITGLAWYLVCTAAYLLVAPLHALLAWMAPPSAQQDVALAQQVGHLYLAAYIPGVICLALVGLGARRLANLTLAPAVSYIQARWRAGFCWLLAALAAGYPGLVWAGMSGLEAALAAAVTIWMVVFLLEESRSSVLRWSLLLAALLPWARPDLLAAGVACLAWLLIRLITAGRASQRDDVVRFLLYLGALALGTLVWSAIYWVGWGRPLPSSFYAKVGGLRVGSRFVSAVQELLIAGRWSPFLAGAAALVGAGLGVVTTGSKQTSDHALNEHRLAALLVLLVPLFYVAAIMASLPWFGQEDRYLIPVEAFVLVASGMLVWRLVMLIRLPVPPRPEAALFAGLVLILFLPLLDYIWATRTYVVQVRNINDAHVVPGLWLAHNTPAGSVVASEPIGAVKLFSDRRTVDLVGLTSPETLGTYGQWSLAGQALKSAGAGYLLYYPRWFDGGRPPPWAVEQQRFDIPDNQIAGDNLIAIYELHWDRFTPP